MKSINIQIDDELHKEMRLEAIRQGKSVKQYITDLIKNAMNAKKE